MLASSYPQQFTNHPGAMMNKKLLFPTWIWLLILQMILYWFLHSRKKFPIARSIFLVIRKDFEENKESYSINLWYYANLTKNFSWSYTFCGNLVARFPVNIPHPSKIWISISADQNIKTYIKRWTDQKLDQQISARPPIKGWITRSNLLTSNQTKV